ncbi:MAG: DoxX family protein, partial [Actinomycetes bacterium]
MTVVRRLARPMLASVFISGGLEALRNPEPKVPAAQDVAPPIAAKLPYLPEDPESLVKINGAVQVGAGTLLALGR